MSQNNFFYNIEKSAVITFIGIVLLFSGAVAITLIAPNMVDPTWTQPTSRYQVQVYEVADPHLYISASQKGGGDLQYVNHLKEGFTLLSFQESSGLRIIGPSELERYITRLNDPVLKLTSKLLLLRKPQKLDEDKIDFNGYDLAEKLRAKLQKEWEEANPDWLANKLSKPDFTILEIYDPKQKEAFSLAPSDTLLENWVDSNFKILDESPQQTWHQDKGVIYVLNPIEYRISHFKFANSEGWKYDPQGEKIASIEVLESHPLGFRSRKELIQYGEQLFATEGCWYCHTDQTRTLIQDVVLNGSDSFPAPPSSANEYIYQYWTFAGTRRIGPDISRVGVKRPSRDWHKAHFWSPKTASKGSIMPSFQHFFDFDPRGTSKAVNGIPNFKFEAMFQYLMTKGTRITPPTEAWWLGKDPIDTIAIIEGKKVLPP